MIEGIGSLASNFTPAAIAATPLAQCAGVGALIGTTIGAVTSVALSYFSYGVEVTTNLVLASIVAIPLNVIYLISNMFSAPCFDFSNTCSCKKALFHISAIVALMALGIPAGLGALAGLVTKITVDTLL